MLGAGFITRTLGSIFVGMFDAVAYTLVSMSYRIFLAVSELDLFGGGTAGAALYEMFTKKMYLVLSVVMLFIFAYELILLLINPDGDGTKKTTGLLKDFVISIALVVVLPVVFKYMTVFQLHVIKNNTIGALVLGTAPTSSNTDETAYGDSIGMVVLMAFYHPQGAGYDSFFETTGEFKGIDQSVADCEAGGEASHDTCQLWAEALDKWNTKMQNSGLAFAGRNDITNNKDLINTLGDSDGSEYMWILCTGCGILVAWFFISYAIDLGTRAVKLGVLEIISPIPVMFNAIPKMKKSFETWKGELIKTYVELFVRLAIIFFIVKLCTLVPEFVEIIFKDSMTGVKGDFLVKAITMVVLILGLLKFAKEAPELFKSLFDNGGGLFKGLNFKPGVKGRIESNEYAMKGMSAVTGAALGAFGNFAQRYRQAQFDKDGNRLENSHKTFSALTALTAAPRGLITGARSGLKNSSSTLKGLKDTGYSAIADAHTSEENAFNRDFRTAVRQTYRDNRDDGRTNAEDSMLLDHIKNNGGEWLDKKKAFFGNIGGGLKNFGDELSGKNQTFSSREVENLNKISGSLSSLENYVKSGFDKATDSIIKAKTEALKKTYEKGRLAGRTAEQINDDIKRINEKYTELINQAKTTYLSKNANQVEVLASSYKQLDKDIRNANIDSRTMRAINEKIYEKVGVSSVSELVAKANNAAEAKDYTQFLKAMDTMKDIHKIVDDAKAADALFKKQEEDKKKDKK